MKKMHHLRLYVLVLLLGCMALAGCRKTESPAPAAVAASNSFLECAAKDLLGSNTPVLRLADPGMCPGHFDIRPSEVEALRRAKILLRFDFQKSLDAQVGGEDAGVRIVEVRISGGLCEPESYLAACKQLADAFVETGLMPRALADHKLQWIGKRLDEQGKAARQMITKGGLIDCPVLSSIHQEAFCKWLGLRPVATFSGADSAGVGQVDAAVKQGEQAGAKLVIANLPEGRRVADALAERLKAKVVVFGNFPSMSNGQSSFDDLLQANVNAVLEAAAK
jgi:zinc transport system substrate-binding protein